MGLAGLASDRAAEKASRLPKASSGSRTAPAAWPQLTTASRAWSKVSPCMVNQAAATAADMPRPSQQTSTRLSAPGLGLENEVFNLLGSAQ